MASVEQNLRSRITLKFRVHCIFVTYSWRFSRAYLGSQLGISFELKVVQSGQKQKYVVEQRLKFYPTDRLRVILV